MTATCFAAGSHRPIRLEQGVYVGGTYLLQLFRRRLSQLTAGQICVVSPFITDSFLRDRPDGLFRQIRHERFSLSIITSDKISAAAVLARLGSLPWRRLRVSWRPDLHGKMYLARAANGPFTALIGSHNLTNGGMRANVEFGVMFTGLAAHRDEVFLGCWREARRLEERGYLAQSELTP